MKNKSLGLYNIIDTEGINKSINNVLSNGINFNTYTSPKGLKELRMQISNFLYNIWNYNVNYKDMLITTGSQQSINLIAYSLLNQGGVNELVIIDTGKIKDIHKMLANKIITEENLENESF